MGFWLKNRRAGRLFFYLIFKKNMKGINFKGSSLLKFHVFHKF